MYDLPGYHLPIQGNLPLNILKAAKTGEVLRFSRNDYRGVGYVREVIENLVPAMELPGGVYNFGSECDGDMVETARCFANLLQVDVKIEESDLTRNLAMDTGKLRAHGIEFSLDVGRTSGVSRRLPTWIFDVKREGGCPRQPLLFIISTDLPRSAPAHFPRCSAPYRR